MQYLQKSDETLVHYKIIMYLCIVIIKKVLTSKKRKPMDDILEKRIEFLETMLTRYRQISDRSGISYRSQSDTIDEMLDELSKLYKQRKRK